MAHIMLPKEELNAMPQMSGGGLCQNYEEVELSDGTTLPAYELSNV